MPTDTRNYLDTIADLLDRYFDLFPQDADRLGVLAGQVNERSSDLCHRGGLPGHLTASALVYDQHADAFLLIQHNFLKRWLQPGGHMDGCEEPVAAALRELAEEVGQVPVRIESWQEKNGVPIDIDSHKIPANAQKNEPEHLHHDLQYVFFLEEHKQIALQEEEVSGFKWAPSVELKRGDYGQRLARTVLKMEGLGLLKLGLLKL